MLPFWLHIVRRLRRITAVGDVGAAGVHGQTCTDAGCRSVAVMHALALRLIWCVVCMRLSFLVVPVRRCEIVLLRR